ncbi:MAG: NAD(P)-dependent oxidoreductase [Alphaproteobacteria bacterium]|jgi:3-hydroxyisobutyrate dehydrogenase-like beta-hydroxyacid dehydrogenase|nr:NAD(P)-dependent oxidoreductase [Alphaproteobacteria bacterium]
MSNLFKKIGFIGVGLMGYSFVKRLSQAEYNINAYDKDENKLKLVKNIKNVSCSQNPSAVANECNLIFICVDKTENVEEVVFGENGVIQNASKNSIIVDLSTTSADKTILFADKVKLKKKVSWVDAPVSGGPSKALDGSLAIMIGGDSKNIKLITPVLDKLSSNFTHFGPVGSGQIVKMINQILVLNNYAILAEALSFAEGYGIDASKIPDALSDGHAGSNLLTHLFPRMINKDFDPQGYATQIQKDLKMVCDLADKKNIPTPLSSLTKQLFSILNNKSKQNLDGTSIVKLFDKNRSL